MKLTTKFLACIGLLWGFAAQASTASYSFYCITNTSPTNCSTGANQLSVDVSSTINPNQVLFTFKNTGAAPSSITDVYFDDGTLLGIASITSSAGVSFSQDASPPNLPGGGSMTPQFQTTAGFLADSNTPVSINGVNPNEWLSILFNLQSSQTYANVLAALDSNHLNQAGDLRIGIHVQSFGNGDSESFVNDPGLPPQIVPIPAAAWLLGSGLIGLVGVARRKVSQQSA